MKRWLYAPARRVAALLACLAFFSSGCNSSTSTAQPTVLTEAAERRELVIAVDTAQNPHLMQAMDYFAEKAEEYSRGTLGVSMRDSRNPVGEFSMGEVQVIFIDSAKNSSYSDDFPLLCQAARYDGYTDFSMSLNADRVLRILNENPGKRPGRLMAAYYQGGSFLVSAPSVQELRQAADDTPYIVAVPGETPSARALELYGMEIARQPDARQRLRMLVEEGAHFGEFTSDELYAVDWEESGMFLASKSRQAAAPMWMTGNPDTYEATDPFIQSILPEEDLDDWEEYDLHLTADRISMAPLWLVVDDDVFDRLSPLQQAAIREAAAGLFSVIDRYYLELEQASLIRMSGQGVQTGESFDGLRQVAEALDYDVIRMDQKKQYLLQQFRTAG